MTDLVQKPVVLVGSLPFESAEESFRAVSRSLSGKIGWIPDGEFGERINWTAMLPEFVYSKQRDLDEIVAPPTRGVEQPPITDAPFPTDTDGFWNLDIGDTKVYLGIVHHTDTIDDFRRRRDLARKYLPDFGISHVCGYGRVDPNDAKEVLDLHAADADEL